MSVRKKISSPRKQYRAWWWDYHFSKAYFITINCRNRLPFFGSIIEEEFLPSPIGKLIEQEWTKTPQKRPDMNLTLGPYVIMPDHFHSIIHIGDNEYNQSIQKDSSANHGDSAVAPHCFPVAPHCNAVLQDGLIDPFLFPKNPIRSFGPQSKCLSAIVRGFKGTTTLNARKINPSFAWQSRFHDRIIRNEKEYEAIVWYIQNNVKNYTPAL